MLEKAEEKFIHELDVKVMVSKLRDSYDFTTRLINRQYKSLLKFHRSRTINVDTSSSNSCSSSSDVSDSSDEDFDIEAN